MRDATVHRIHSIPDHRGAEWILLKDGVWTAARDLGEALAAGLAPRSEAVEVHGDHGRWIVKCPDCNGAQLAAPNDHRFMCNECANISVDGLWRPVIWPPDPRRLGELLDVRADRSRANYVPGETVAQLTEENRALDAEQGLVEGPPLQLQGDAWPKDHKRHSWPSRVVDDAVYTCPGCGAMYDGVSIKGERKS